MLDLLRRKKNTIDDTADHSMPSEKLGLLSRLKKGLAKTRAHFSSGIANLILGKKTLDTDLLDTIETYLLTADVGVEATQQLIQTLTHKLARKELTDIATVLL